MREQPTEITSDNEVAKATSSNNSDTLTTSQNREKSARELGISYKESLTMSAKQLDQKIAEKNDPHFEQKQLFLEANNKIADMQVESPAPVEHLNPITKETAVADGVYFENMGPITKEQAIAAGDYSDDTQKFTLYDKANLLFATALSKFGERFSKTSKESKYTIGATAIVAVMAYKSGILNEIVGVDTAHAAAQGQTGASGATGEATNGTGGAKFEPKPSLPVFGEIDTNTNNNPDGTYNRYDPHARDRMSTEGAFDGTERNAKELDNHVLEKIKNNPSLMASVLEVRESGNKEGSFSLSDVNHDTRKYSVPGEHGEYSAKGEKAVDTLERSWDHGSQGKLLSKSEVSKIMDKYDFINHGTDGGNFKNAIDDKVHDAGKFDYRPDLGDQIYKKKLGNGETVYFKVNEKDPTRDCLNVQTLLEKGSSTSTITTPTTDYPNPEPNPNPNPEPEPEPEPEPTPETPNDDDKKPKDDINANPNLNEQVKVDEQVPAGDPKPATQPGPTYTPPAPPQAPETPRPTPPPTQETGTPPQNNPATGTTTKP